MSEPSPWWMPHIHVDRRSRLLARNAIKTALRAWFVEQGFVEVETACLQVSPGNEAHLHAFKTCFIAPDGVSSRLFLHTSPEFAAKKLLAAGERRIFTFAPAFRNREHGPLHYPEFTMLEWYRVEEPYTRTMQDCADILKIASRTAGTEAWAFNGREMRPFRAPEHLTVTDAFTRYAGVVLRGADGAMHDRETLAAGARAAGLRVAEDDTWGDIFSRVMTLIEPLLGTGCATVLDEYPLSEAALARPSRHDRHVAERFELYACGVELANGFGELTDPIEQRQRFEIEMMEKQRLYGERYPIDEDFLSALAYMPPASGVALGFDRLVMLATGARDVGAVMWTPVTGT